MEILFNIPAIIKIAFIFMLVLIIIRCNYSLGTALLAGSLLLGLWSRMNLIQIATSMGTTVIQTKTIMLNAIVVLILILSRSMDKLHQMKRLLSSFQGLTKNAKFNLVTFPALIGLLPMPGGAIFSAPMVDELGKEHDLDPETKSLLNYWFRHIWETVWPLYPGLLLATSLASLSVWQFIRVSFPLALISISVGYVFLLRRLPTKSLTHQKEADTLQWISFLKEIIPIIIVILGALAGTTSMAWLQKDFSVFRLIPSEFPLVLSLIVGIVFVWKNNKASYGVMRSILWNKALIKMIYMITAIYIFKQILVDSETVTRLSEFLASKDIPLPLVIIILPAIVGAISGVAVAFVGTTFPVLISLLQTIHPESSMVPYLILGYYSGFIGFMSSPLHVCLIFTREYFQADFRRLYYRLWKLLTVSFACALIYFSILIMFEV